MFSCFSCATRDDRLRLRIIALKKFRAEEFGAFGDWASIPTPKLLLLRHTAELVLLQVAVKLCKDDLLGPACETLPDGSVANSFSEGSLKVWLWKE